METNSHILALILAAGKGTRMKSSLPKPLIPLGNRPIVQYIIDSLKQCSINQIGLVVGYQSDLVMAALGSQFEYVLQSEQKGTAHAVSLATRLISPYEKVIIFVGDSPLIQPGSIKRLIESHAAAEAACSFLTAIFPKSLPYARVIRDGHGNVLRCVEEDVATGDQIGIREYLTSHYIFHSNYLLKYLDNIKPHVGAEETYLTDIAGILVDSGHTVNAVIVDDYRQLVGLNTPQDLLWAEGILDQYDD